MKFLISLLLLSALFTSCGFEVVEEGSRGIEKRFGKVVGEPLPPGLQFYNPFTSSILELEVREQLLEAKSTCFTKDTQTVYVQFALNYYAQADKIGELYSQLGSEWEAKLVHNTVYGVLKDQVGQYIADDLISKREAVKHAVQLEMTKVLKARDIHVTSLNLTNIDFEDAYEKAVEAKVVAIQKAHEAKNKTVEVMEQAKQTIEQAKAEAESMRIRSNALSQNRALVEYEAVLRWDGKLPTQILGGSPVPFINLNSFGK